MNEKSPKSSTGERLESHPKPTKEQSLKEVHDLPPKTRALQGLLKEVELDEEDYKKYIMEKYSE